MKTMKFLFTTLVLLAFAAGAQSQPVGWVVDPSAYENSASFTWQAEFRTAESVEAADYMAAFVGGEVRGVVQALYHPGFMKYYFPMLVYSDLPSEDGVTFRFYDASRDTYYNVTANDSDPVVTEFSFVLDQASGSFADPLHSVIDDLQAQSINFDALSTVTFGDAPFDLTGSSSSGLTVSYVSSNEEVATISGNTVTIVGTGTTTITASQGGDAFYNPAADVVQDLTVNKAVQTITFDALSEANFGDSFELMATANSGLTITYTSSEESVATIDGNVVTIHAPGTTTITATQLGDDNYFEATEVQQDLVANKGLQTVVFDDLPSKAFGDTSFDLNASGGASGMPVTFASSDETVATIAGNTVTIVGPGTTLITASQLGDDLYAAADDATQTLTVDKGAQTIVIEDIATQLISDVTVEVVATVNTGLVLDYDVSGPATINSNVITLNGTTGIVTVTVSQIGDDEYNPASSTATFEVIDPTKEDQTITFDAISDRTYGDDSFTIIATASSGLDVSFRVVSGPATLDQDEVTITGAGEVVIEASQEGNAFYNPAPFVEQTVNVQKATLTVTALDQNKIYGEENPELTFAYTGFVLNDDPTDLDTAPTASTAAGRTSGAGDYTIAVGGGVDANYVFEYDPGTLSIGKASLSITADDQTITYGETMVLSLSFSGWANEDDENDLAELPMATIAKGAGTHDIVLEGGADDNYSLTLINGKLQVNPATLHVRPDTVQVAYGDLMPQMILSYAGFVNNDDVSDITAPTATTTAQLGDHPGMYPVTLQGGQADNYTLVLSDGVLEITKAMLTVSAVNDTITYGDDVPEPQISYSGFVGDDSEETLEIIPQATLLVASSSDAGFYAIEVSGGISQVYDFDYRVGVFVIEKALAAITASNLRQAANGGQKEPKIETDPPGLPLQITYNGVTEAPSEAGEYAVEVVVTDPNYQGRVSFTLFLEQALSAGGPDVAQIAIYPNPASEWIQIEGLNEPFQLSIFTTEGKRVAMYDINKWEDRVPVSSLEKGLYLMVISRPATGVSEMRRLMIR
ncbi:MAG: MBG domain-containing protein [Bacteroidota bacterium]